MTLRAEAWTQPGRDTAVPLADLLHRLSGETAQMATRLSRVEAAVARLADTVPAVGPEDLGTLQDLDLLRQMLADVSALLATLAQRPALFPADITATLRLRDLAARLTGPRHPAGAEPFPPGGEVEVF